MKQYTKQLQATKLYAQEFDSLSEFATFLRDKPYSQLCLEHNREPASTERYIDNWAGTSTYEEAVKLLSSGWLPKAEILAQKVPISTVSADVKSSRTAYSVAGFQASVPRYLQGVPTNMIDRKPDIKKQKIIVLNKNISYSGDVTAKEIEEQGIKVLQCIQALENKGYRVKLNMIRVNNNSTYTTHATETSMLKVCIKKPEERLSLSKIAFPLCHPAMLRRLAFGWNERFELLSDKFFVTSYGTPDNESYKKIMAKGEYLVPNVISSVDGYVKTLGL